MVNINTKISQYQGSGNRGELKGFKSRAYEIRVKTEELYRYINDNNGNVDPGEVQRRVDDIKTTAGAMDSEFDAWVIANTPIAPPPPPPTQGCDGSQLSCATNQIQNLNDNICACATINRWDELVNAENALPGLWNKIQSLSGGTIRTKLEENWKTINDKLGSLRQYVISDAKVLDLDYVQASCIQILNWFAQLKTDTATASGGSGSACDISICNNGWTFSQSDCSCACVPSRACNSANEALDYYHCQCAPKTSCSLTQAQCPSGQYLDYSACICRAAP